MITFACVWVTGHVPFTADYVVRLRNMVARHYPERHSFVCLTDRPAELAGIETIRTGAPVGYFAWWKKLELFAAKRLDRGRVVYLDLDTLVLADLTPIVEYPAPSGTIVVDAATRRTSREGLFAGGDVVLPAATVIVEG